MKRKQHNPTDSELFNLFRDYCSTDEDCDQMVKGAKKAYTMLSADKLYRSYSSREEVQ